MHLPPESPQWTTFLSSHHIPPTLPSPIPLPRARNLPPDAPSHQTTNPIQWICAGYLIWMAAFEQHWMKQKMSTAKQAQAETTAMAATKKQAKPPPPPLPADTVSQVVDVPASSPVSVASQSAITDQGTGVQSTSGLPVSGNGGGSVQDGKRPSSKGKMGDGKSLTPVPKIQTADVGNGIEGRVAVPDSAGGKKRKRDKRGECALCLMMV